MAVDKKSSEKPTGLIQSPEGLFYQGQQIQYRVTGLKPYDLARLQVTLKANKPESPDAFLIDVLNLYQRRARDNFVDACVKNFFVKTADVQSDLNTLIRLLEEERVRIREDDPSNKIPDMSAAEEKQAIKSLSSPKLIENITRDFERIGYVGERENLLMGYIATISRLLPDPLGILIISNPAAGKTALQSTVCKFVPPEGLIEYTRLTGQSLFYRDKNSLKHRVLAIEEEDGMKEALYSIRTLQSSQKLTIATTRNDAKTGKMSVEEHTVSGPVSVFISTTNPKSLDPETRQRFLILTVDESPEQTRAIVEIQRQKNTLEWLREQQDESEITKLHHNMQRILKPYRVVIPDSLKITFPFFRVQVRREAQKFMSLVKAITLLHQYQRKIGKLNRADGTTIEYIVATREDFALAMELGKEPFSRNLDDVNPKGRELLRHITELISSKHELLQQQNPDPIPITQIPISRIELCRSMQWSEPQIRRHLTPLVEMGYLGVLAGRQGTQYRYVLLDDGSADMRTVLNGKSRG